MTLWAKHDFTLTLGWQDSNIRFLCYNHVNYITVTVTANNEDPEELLRVLGISSGSALIVSGNTVMIYKLIKLT